MAVYPEAMSLCAEKEAGHPTPALSWSPPSGWKLEESWRPKAEAAPFASSWRVPVPGDRKCSAGRGYVPAAGGAARAGSPLSPVEFSLQVLLGAEKLQIVVEGPVTQRKQLAACTPSQWETARGLGCQSSPTPCWVCGIRARKGLE